MIEENRSGLNKYLLLAFIFISLVVPTSLIFKNTIALTAQAQKKINDTSSLVDSIPTKKVKVGDIDISYKIFGKGEPLLLIPGFSMTMDMWEPIGLDKLSSNHTIIIFDNRGIGKPTAGNKTPSIQLFANDTAGLIDALGIRQQSTAVLETFLSLT
jgi:hypothetical protein